jgi:hypothetical protein
LAGDFVRFGQICCAYFRNFFQAHGLGHGLWWRRHGFFWGGRAIKIKYKRTGSPDWEIFFWFLKKKKKNWRRD